MNDKEKRKEYKFLTIINTIFFIIGFIAFLFLLIMEIIKKTEFASLILLIILILGFLIAIVYSLLALFNKELYLFERCVILVDAQTKDLESNL